MAKLRAVDCTSPPWRAMKALPVAASALLLLAASAATARTWTNDEGESLEADILRLKGRTAILRSNGSKEISAPIARLSPADQAWIERYKQLTQTREWGTPGKGVRRGQFLNVSDGSVQLKQGSSTSSVPFEELSPEGWLKVQEAYELYEKEPEAEFLLAKPVALQPREDGVDPLAAPMREWTDVKGRAIRAAYLGTDGPNALLFLRAKEVAVPLTRLCEADRKWVAEQKFARFRGGLQQATAAFAQMAMRASANPSLQQQLAPPPAAAPEPTTIAAVETPPAPEAPVEPVTTSTGRPRLRHINRLSNSEQRQRLEEAFGDLGDLEEGFVGTATCDQCKGYFIFPEDYGIGDPCPYCSDPIQEVASAGGPRAGGSARATAPGSAPWYRSGLVRGLIAVAVVTVLGVVTKLAMSGGGDEDEEDEDE